jgi:cell division protein FtsI/penicillin-binding protein 2
MTTREEFRGQGDRGAQRTRAAGLVIRVKVLKLFLLGLFALIGGRLCWMQLIDSRNYITRVDNVISNLLGYHSVQLDKAPRGLIVDREGRPFATQKVLRRVTMEPTALQRPDESLRTEDAKKVLEVLTRFFPDRLNGNISDFGRFADPENPEGDFIPKVNVLLNPEMTDEDWSRLNRELGALEDLKVDLSRLVIERRYFRRHYVEGDMLSHVLGKTSKTQVNYFGFAEVTGEDGQKQKIKELLSHSNRDIGESGLEKILEDYLQPGFGYRKSVFNRFRNFRVEQLKPEAGEHIVLAIDKHVQFEAEMELDRIMEEHDPVSAAIIITHPATGDVIAIASAPRFDLNELGDFGWGLRDKVAIPNSVQRTIAFSDHFSPGSTFKPLILGAALELGRLSEGAMIQCDGTYSGGSGPPVSESSGKVLGLVPWQDVIAQSSNTGTARIMVEYLGFKNGYQFIKKLGFGERTSRFLEREARGDLRGGPQDYNPVDYPRFAIGQSISVSGIQMMMAYGCIANGGTLYEPRIIDRFFDGDHAVETSVYPSLVRGSNIFSEKTCRLLNDAMVRVVEEGTATNVKMNDFLVAGKTGTAEIKTSEAWSDAFRRRHSYISSFIGYFPASHPLDPEMLEDIRKQRYCIGVWVKGPKRGGSYYGGTVAGPHFTRMARFLARYFRIPPDREVNVSSTRRVGRP